MSDLAWTSPDDVRLHGERQGAGPTVVLLHGGFQTRGSWRHAITTLTAHGFEVVAYDLRGHGDSGRAPAGDYSEQAHARDLAALLELLETPVALVGASLGGAAALLVASDHARTGAAVRGIVLVDVVPRLRVEGRDRIRRFMTAHAEGFKDMDEAARLVAAYTGGPPRPGGGLTRSLREAPDGRLRWHWDSAMVTQGFDDYDESRIEALLRRCRAVEAPTLVLRGEHSDVVDPAGVAELLAVLPRGTHEEVPGVGHMVAAMPNNPYVDATVRFLDQLRRSSWTAPVA